MRLLRLVVPRSQPPSEPELAAIMRRVTRRIIPFLLLMYVLAFLDRVNIGFAKAEFQADTGVSEAAYALGAGIFFIGYTLFEVPSNLLMHRIGARVWLARIMVTWGLISAAMMFAHNEVIFYTLRVLLGIAEAGFFPGVILYLTYWAPAAYRGRLNGLFYFGAPLAFILGSPLSGALLTMDGLAQLAGWQWMFLVQGLLTVAVGIAVFRYLDNTPADARWLSTAERATLMRAMEADERQRAPHAPTSALRSLADIRVLYLSVIYFAIQASVYGVSFYLPTQVSGLLGDDVGLTVGVVTAVPWVCAIAAVVGVSRVSDRTGDRRWVPACTLGVAGLGIAGSAATASPLVALVALCFAAAGFIAVQPTFWTLPAGVLTGATAASGIAMVNALGSLGGFAAPNIRTMADTALGANAGMYTLAFAALAGAVLLMGVRWLGLRASEAAPEASARPTTPSPPREKG